LAWAWLHIHAARGGTWKQGVHVLRVDWPVYPRRVEHNTVAEGGNRRWAEADQRTSGRRHQRRLTSPPLPSRGARRSTETGKIQRRSRASRRPSQPSQPVCREVRQTPVPLRGLRHCGRRRQERHSISAATPSSISTVTPSPMIASLVGRFMIKTLHEKGPGLLPGRRPQL
jgi:hypothetical protein